MQAIDTNVIVRLLVRDDQEQGRRAEALLRRASETGGVWIAQVVIVEVAWVLRSAYKFDRSSIAGLLRKLLGTDGVSVEGVLLVQAALAAFETGAADLADYVILESARRAEALPLWTFDERLAQAEGVERVP